ncbi:DUF2628 domain-containing protein [Entomomonas moraniae]|uniref:DUF2628 domain-containing protein n=1 Tax=Entomomonas moraniae TaxID=2213226 RepID=A0A3S9XGV6_9GAMM|nr:DUF2628 domain-containing protein [Entomomonas moraniae]AZS51687.1 DUF2628 domain-containing protein [Entomomonas moraniae]
MNDYKIFKSSSDSYEAVKQGWSWPAFFFDILWALIKQLWGVAAIIFVVTLLIVIFLTPSLQGLPDDQVINTMNNISFIIGTPLRIILGVFGNKLREQNLIKKNYVLVGNIASTSPAKAIEQYLNGNNSFLEM